MLQTSSRAVMPYVQRRPNGYYYRQRVPKVLQGQLGKTEFVFTLSTRCPRLAACRAAELYVAMQQLSDHGTCSLMEHFTLTHERASKIADRWKRDQLNEDFDRRLSARPPMDSPHALSERYRQAIDDLRRINLGPHAGMINEVVSERSLELDEKSDDWRRLGYYLLKANTELLQEIEKRSDLARHHPMAYIPPEEGEEQEAVEQLRLSGALESWSQEIERRPATVMEWGICVRRFIELKGDMYVGDITVADVRDFKTACQRIPRHLKAADRRQRLPEILYRYENLEVQRLSADSVNKILSAISSVLSWCVDNGYLKENVARGVRVPKPKITKQRRLPFTLGDLKAIFEDSPVFREGQRPRGGAGHAAYWLPVLALYTGARLEELGQLALDDVRSEGAILYLDINADAENKSVKTQSSIRRVPLSSEVIGLGFMDYMDEVRRRGQADLFPYVRSNVGKRTASFSKWVNRYFRDRCGITDSRKVFHSFRHTFKDACRNAGIPQDVHDALTGHTDSSVGARYGQGHGLQNLAAAMEKISYSDLNIKRWGH